MSLDTKFIPLTFINSEEDILKQIKNTVVFSFLFNQFEKTTLTHYVETTQYGYTASANANGTHKLLRITDINNGSVNWENVPFCNCDSEKKYLLMGSDILIARTGGTTGKSFIVSDVPSNAIFASYLIRLRLKDNVNVDFINIFLNSYTFWSQLVEMKSGSAMPNVNAEKLKTLKLPKCDFDTQCKIVAVLKKGNNHLEYSHLFERMTSVECVFNNGNAVSSELTRQLDLVKKLRKQLLQDAVQGKLVKQVGGVEPACELLKKIKTEKAQLIKAGKLKKEKELSPIKAEEIPFEIPENWTWCRLGDVANFLNGYAFKSEWFDDEGIPLLRNINMGVNEIIWNDIARLPEIKAEEYAEYYLSIGDIILSLDRPIINAGLKVAQVREVDIPCLLLQRVLKVEPLTINKNYVYMWFNSELFINSINPGRSIGIPHISHNDVSKVLFPLPPLSEQRRIVQKLEQLLQVCADLEQSIQASQTQNEKLLQQVLREALRQDGPAV